MSKFTVMECRETAFHTEEDTGYYDPNGHSITEERYMEVAFPKQEQHT